MEHIPLLTEQQKAALDEQYPKAHVSYISVGRHFNSDGSTWFNSVMILLGPEDPPIHWNDFTHSWSEAPKKNKNKNAEPTEQGSKD